MPGRFKNLEFEDEHRNVELEPKTSRDAAYDEHSYLARAIDENRWGRFDKALQMYTRCLEHNRAVIPAWVGQVQMLVQLGELSEARLWADKALELFRNNGELLAAKAQACVRLDDYAAGIACSDASVQSPGSSAWRWQIRGEALLAKRQGQFDYCFQKSLNEPDADWFDRVVVARIYLFYRRATNAMQYLKDALALEPTHGYTWFVMGQCQEAIGLTSAARDSYARCLELRHDYREAQAALDAVDSMSFLSWLKRRLGLGTRR
jgi:tetratricopeptide (TPR) repeat protein